MGVALYRDGTNALLNPTNLCESSFGSFVLRIWADHDGGVVVLLRFIIDQSS